MQFHQSYSILTAFNTNPILNRGYYVILKWDLYKIIFVENFVYFFYKLLTNDKFGVKILTKYRKGYDKERKVRKPTESCRLVKDSGGTSF